MQILFRHLHLWLTVLLLATAHVAAAEPGAATVDAPADADWILARLARPAPARTPFVELRGSTLLKAPLRIVGEYRREADDTLVRRVLSPYAETTTIGNGSIRIERDGRSVRRFAMSRAPELAALQASFGALLAGDRARLERHYRIEAAGRRRHWTLTLVPRDMSLAERMARVVLHGRGAELRCIESRPVEGDVQRSLLAGAVAEAESVDDPDALRALCHGDAPAASATQASK